MDRKFYNDVMEFVLEQAATQPTTKRAKLYRGLAVLVCDDPSSAQLNKLADDLESADRRCREFAFQFSNRREG